MATVPGPAPKDPNYPKTIRKLYCGAWLVFKKEKGITSGEAEKEWGKLSDSQKRKYGEKATKNREKRKALLEKYKQTPQFKVWMQKRKAWLRSIKKFYPPKPKKGSKNYEEQMRIWERAKHRVKLSANEGRLEESHWMQKYLKRKEREQNKHNTKKRSKKKGKKKWKKGRKANQNKLAAITKAMQKVTVKTGQKGKKKGAKKLNQSRKGKKIEKKVKKQQNLKQGNKKKGNKRK